MSFGQVGDLPGTRAGGQDDVSSHKLPQISAMREMPPTPYPPPQRGTGAGNPQSAQGQVYYKEEEEFTNRLRKVRA